MNIANMPVVLLVAVLLTITVLFYVVRSVKMPNSFFKNQIKRSDMRMRLLAKEHEEKHPKVIPAQEDES